MHDQRNAELPFSQPQPCWPSSRTGQMIHGQGFSAEGSLPHGLKKKRKYSQQICTKETLALETKRNFFRRQCVKSSCRQCKEIILCTVISCQGLVAELYYQSQALGIFFPKVSVQINTAMFESVFLLERQFFQKQVDGGVTQVSDTFISLYLLLTY